MGLPGDKSSMKGYSVTGCCIEEKSTTETRSATLEFENNGMAMLNGNFENHQICTAKRRRLTNVNVMMEGSGK